MKKSKIKILWTILRIILVISLLVLVGYVAFSSGLFIANRNHGEVTVNSLFLEESAKALRNPDRGFYEIYGYMISDDEQEFAYLLSQELFDDKDTTLSMIQINLQQYNQGPISEKGLENIDKLFEALAIEDKHYLIRFLYDWDGKNLENEPEDVEIILTHMEQLETIFHKYEDLIFVQQGLFIGNWGEMNGSNHLDELDVLAKKLETVTGESTYLAVRKPSQWRTIVGFGNINVENLASSPLVMRLGLFNDGMLGNEFDVGTYSMESREEAGDFSSWTKAEELEFQEQLCAFVPNGGEVIYSNPLNDLESAVEYLAKTHVTYLNRAYDTNVLSKWKNTIVTEEGVFYGMDGLSYVERHLGYRLFIADTKLEYEFMSDKLSTSVVLKNVGFAPMYENPNMYLVIQNTETKEATTYPVLADICQLTGGVDKEKTLTIQKEISLEGFEAGQYEIFFYMEDADSKVHIQLANECDEEQYGYKIGQMQLGTIEEWLEGSLHKK